MRIRNKRGDGVPAPNPLLVGDSFADLTGNLCRRMALLPFLDDREMGAEHVDFPARAIWSDAWEGEVDEDRQWDPSCRSADVVYDGGYIVKGARRPMRHFRDAAAAVRFLLDDPALVFGRNGQACLKKRGGR